jgi:hypothetical protein
VNVAAYSKQSSALQSSNRRFFGFLHAGPVVFSPHSSHMSKKRRERRLKEAGARQAMSRVEEVLGDKARRISIFGRDFTMPRSRAMRVVIGVALVIGGCLGFLPVLGFWMIPLGLLVLSYEFASVRRWRRRFELWWAERRGRRKDRRR